MRSAETVLGIITGKRCDAKVSRTVWREADGKGLPPEYLAGGPPYPVPSGPFQTHRQSV